MDIKEIYEGKAKRYNHYQEDTEIHEDRTCITCIRRQFSYPYTCSDGWKNGTENKGKKCMNWTDTSLCNVD